MKIAFSDRAIEALKAAPSAVRTSFNKQIRFLVNNLHHPSLRAKKYDETRDLWQAVSIGTGDSISQSSGILTRSRMLLRTRSSDQKPHD